MPRVWCMLIFPVNSIDGLIHLFTLRKRDHSERSSSPTSSFPPASTSIRQTVSSLKGIQTISLSARRRLQTKPSCRRLQAWFADSVFGGAWYRTGARHGYFYVGERVAPQCWLEKCAFVCFLHSILWLTSSSVLNLSFCFRLLFHILRNPIITSLCFSWFFCSAIGLLH